MQSRDFLLDYPETENNSLVIDGLPTIQPER